MMKNYKISNIRIFEWIDPFDRPTGLWGWGFSDSDGHDYSSFGEKMRLVSAAAAAVNLANILIAVEGQLPDVDLANDFEFELISEDEEDEEDEE
jgi:hypothetical protein